MNVDRSISASNILSRGIYCFKGLIRGFLNSLRLKNVYLSEKNGNSVLKRLKVREKH